MELDAEDTVVVTNKASDDGIGDLLDRIGKASERLVDSSERQAHELDERMKEFIDRSEKATQDFVDRVDKELRTQLASLRKEVAQLQSRLSGAARPAKKAPAKKVAARR